MYKIGNILISIFLLIVVVYGFLFGKAIKFSDELLLSAISDVVRNSRHHFISRKSKTTKVETSKKQGENIKTFIETAKNMNKSLSFNSTMININGYIAKTLHMREIYKNNGGIVLKNGYNVGIYPYTSTDYEIQQITDLKSFLDKKGIQLLYVNEPTKYISDSYVAKDIGILTYINSNTDRFLSRLKDVGINYIDLRKLVTDGNSFEWFYRTDHHWTVPAAKKSVEVIVQELNRIYGYNIDISLYDDNKFKFTKYQDAWLGEQGRKLGVSYVGLDDYTSIIPTYKTSFTILNQNKVIAKGNFEQVLVNTSVYLPEKNSDVYKARSWHYSYLGNRGRIRNNNSDNDIKILVLGDSFEAVTNTFLALGVSEVQGIVRRDFKGSLKQYIDSNNFDIVIIAYAEFMIGAHDNKSSANYRMFDFQ